MQIILQGDNGYFSYHEIRCQGKVTDYNGCISILDTLIGNSELFIVNLSNSKLRQIKYFEDLINILTNFET